MTKTIVISPVNYTAALDFNNAITSVFYFGNSGIVTSEVAAELRNSGALTVAGELAGALLALTGNGMMGGVAYGRKARRKIVKEKLITSLAEIISKLDTDVGRSAMKAVKLVQDHIDDIYKM